MLSVLSKGAFGKPIIQLQRNRKRKGKAGTSNEHSPVTTAANANRLNSFSRNSCNTVGYSQMGTVILGSGILVCLVVFF